MGVEFVLEEVCNSYIDKKKIKITMEDLKDLNIDSDNCIDCLYVIAKTIQNTVFFDKGIVVTIFNSNPIFLDEIFFDITSKVLSYCSDNNDIIYGFLHEFLVLYFLSLNNFVYKNNSKFSSTKSAFEKYFSSKEIFCEYKNVILNYYRILLSNENNSFLSSDFIHRFFIIFNNYNCGENDIDLIIKIIEFKYFLPLVFDLLPRSLKNNNEIINLYNHFLLESVSIITDDKFKLIKYMYKSGKLDCQFIKKSLNYIIQKINSLKERAIEENVISVISEIDDLNEALNSYNSYIEEDIYISKVKECLLSLLFIKRKLLENENYVYRNMQSVKSNFEIDSNYIESVRLLLKETPLNVYSILKFDFIKILEEAIKTRSRYPLSYLFKTININCENKMYFYKNEKYIKVFKVYYDRMGEKIEKELKGNKELFNFIKNGYYETLIRYLDSIKGMNESFLLSIIDLEKLYGDLRLELNKYVEPKILHEPIYDNKYVFIAKMILLIEKNITDIYNHINNKNETRINEPDFLLELFDSCKDDKIKNSLFNLYYNLYMKEGYDLRNNIFHGNNIFENNDYNLLRVVNCLVNFDFIRGYYGK